VNLKAAFREELFNVPIKSYINQLGIVRLLITPHTLPVFVPRLPYFLSARNGLSISYDRSRFESI